MLNRLLKASSAPHGKQATERNNPAARQLGGSPRWSAVALILMGLGLLGGCSGPSQQVLTAQALSQRQAPNRNQDLQNQLMVQATQASLMNYKDYKVGPENFLEVTFFGNVTLKQSILENV